MIRDNDCYGDKKREIVKNYFLNPLAYLKLIPGQVKSGCCGELKDRFVIFSYTGIIDRNDKGIFFVGYDCAKQMVDFINEKKQAANKPLITMPVFFDPTGCGFTSELHVSNINKDILDVILLLASIWDIQKFTGTLPYLLSIIAQNPNRHIDKKDIITLNTIVGKDAMIASEQVTNFPERIKLEKIKLYCPTLPYLKNVLDYFKADGLIEHIYI